MAKNLAWVKKQQQQQTDIDDGRTKKKLKYFSIKSSLQQQNSTFPDSRLAGQSKDFSTGQKKYY